MSIQNWIFLGGLVLFLIGTSVYITHSMHPRQDLVSRLPTHDGRILVSGFLGIVAGIAIALASEPLAAWVSSLG